MPSDAVMRIMFVVFGFAIGRPAYAVAEDNALLTPWRTAESRLLRSIAAPQRIADARYVRRWLGATLVSEHAMAADAFLRLSGELSSAAPVSFRPLHTVSGANAGGRPREATTSAFRAFVANRFSSYLSPLRQRGDRGHPSRGGGEQREPLRDKLFP